MKIPDEGLLKKGQKRIEDIPGYVFCPHCNRCVMNNQNDIYRDGLFYCMYEKSWRKGDELVEFMCRGYIPKSCKTCRWTGCKNRGKGLYCKEYSRMDLSPARKDMMMIGRRSKRAVSASAVKSEELYVKYKTEQYRRFCELHKEEYEQDADNQGDGDEEGGESRLEEEGDADMGNV